MHSNILVATELPFEEDLIGFAHCLVTKYAIANREGLTLKDADLEELEIDLHHGLVF